MKFWRLLSILLALATLPLFPGGNAYAAALGTEFTYQGRLTSGGTAVDQTCGFQFSLFDAVTGGTQQGSTLTKSSVSVSDGLFTVALDFGSSIFTGDAVFLNITVRCPDSGTYTSLSPRQELTPTPYSVFATTAGGVQDNDNDTKIQAQETSDEDKIRFDTAGSERMIIDAAGLVGIGTTSPTSALTITSPVSGALQFDPFGTSAGNTGEERFLELAANGSNYVGWKAPDSIATPEIWTLPNADGSSGQVLRTDGSNVLTWVTPGGFATATLSSATTLSATTEYHTDTSSAAFTATLPSAPADGAAIRIIDVKGDFDTNNLTVARGGSDTIEGGTSVTLSTENGLFDFHYDSGENRWQIAEHDAPAPVTLHRGRLSKTDGASYTSGTSVTDVPMDEATYATGVTLSTTNNTITINQAGTYRIEAWLAMGDLNFDFDLVFDKGGSEIERFAMDPDSAGGADSGSVSFVADLAANDVLKLQTESTTSDSVTFLSGGTNAYLEVIQLPTSAVAGVAISSIQDDDNDTKIQAEETADEDKIRFDTGGSERMIIDAAGQVGIGTSSPVAPLDVAGVTHLVTLGVSGNATFSDSNTLFVDATNDRVGIGSAAPTKGKLEIDQTNGANLQAIFIDSLEDSFSQSVMTVTTSVTSAGTTVFDLDSGGNLSLEGQITVGGASTVYADGSITKSSGSGLNINLGNSAGDDLNVNSGSLVVEGDNKRVGIGTAAPSAFFEVKGAPEAAIPNLRLTDTNTSGGYGILQIDSSQASSGNSWGFIDMGSTESGSRNRRFLLNGAGSLLYDGTQTNSADYAEYFYSESTTLQKGELVCFDKGDKVKRCEGGDVVLGVVSTKPGVIGVYADDITDWVEENENDPHWVVVGLLGQIPTYVEGEIKAGDPLTIGSNGVARKATTSGRIVGYALEDNTADDKIKAYIHANYYSISDIAIQEQQSQIEDLKAQNEQLKQLVCADHQGAEICQGASTSSGIGILPGPGQSGGLMLWIIAPIGAAIAALGTVILFTSRRRSETTA